MDDLEVCYYVKIELTDSLHACTLATAIKFTLWNMEANLPKKHLIMSMT